MKKRINKMMGAVLLAGILAALTVTVVAQSVTRTLSFSRQAKVGSQVIQPGKYSLVYDETKDGDVVVMKDGKEVLKAAYKRTDRHWSRPPSPKSTVSPPAQRLSGER